MPGAGRASAGNVTLPLLLALVLSVTLVVSVPSSSAAAAINPASLLWLVKSNDLGTLSQQAAGDGVSLPAFTWDGCGGPSDPLHCGHGMVPIFTNYRVLEARALAGWRGTAVYDIEPWSFTPADQRHNPDKYICLAAHLQRTDPHLRVVITPFARPPNPVMISEDAEAAKCGAYGVDVQSQFTNNNPTRFASFIRAAVRAIRHVNPATKILAGLATNNPNVVPAADLTDDYQSALAAGVQGFWLNANDWFSKNKCTSVQAGNGCPEIAIEFLEAIGMITDGPAGSTPPPGPTTSTPVPGATTSAPAAGSPSSTPTTSTGTSPAKPANRGSAALQDDFVRLVLQSPLTRLTRLVGGIAVIADCGCDPWVAEDLVLGEVHRA